MESIDKAGIFNYNYIFSHTIKGHNGKVELGMDVAASEFWVPEKKIYDLDFKVKI